jgi:hypothetical protein
MLSSRIASTTPDPASRVQHSRTLRFVYHTPDGIRAFTYAEIRDLPDLV